MQSSDGGAYRDILEAALQRAEALERQIKERRADLSLSPHELVNLERELVRARQAVATARLQHAPPATPLPPSAATAVLTLGILSVSVCPALGPVAWARGKKELERMAAGKVDSSAHGTASAGHVLGIIGTAWLAVVALAVLVAM